MAVVWIILTVGFFILGVKYSLLWGFLIAFLDFLPVFGAGTALFPWGIIKLLGGEYAFAAGLLLIYVLTQVIRQVVQVMVRPSRLPRSINQFQPVSMVALRKECVD